MNDANKIMDQVAEMAGSLFNSNEGILISIVTLLIAFWLAKKVFKMVLGLAFISALVYYMTNYM